MRKDRIGDTAEGIAHFVEKLERPLCQDLVELTQVLKMYEEALALFADCRQALVKNNTEIIRQIIKRDKVLNKIFRKSDYLITDFHRSQPEKIKEGLVLLSIIKGRAGGGPVDQYC